MDRHLIGEELVEPDEQNQFNEDLYDHYADEQMPIASQGSGLLIRGTGAQEVTVTET